MHCPKCHAKIPIKACLLLSNNSILKCKHCQARLQPEKMSGHYLGFGFLCTGPIGYFIAKKYDSLPIGLLYASAIGIILYVIVVLYTYNHTKLFEL